jgi:23S rRNA pseudouridine1911/1915/1917 synthase
MLEVTVPPIEAGNRLDRFLARELGHLSRSRVQALIRDGHVRLNQRAAKPSESLRPADVISWEEPPVAETALCAEQIDLAMLYEDDDLLVLNKAAGMVTHPAPGNEAGTLVNALLAHCPALSGIGGERRPGIVHRLDKDTTGCLVVAKHDRAHRGLAAQFAARSTQKTYLALVQGVPRSAQGTIEAPIGRHPIQRKKMGVVPPPRGRLARTDYLVRRSLPQATTRSTVTVSLLECRLHTGRTHQIRVHLKHLGYPILGDTLYGGSAQWPRPLLHAWKLGFTHPCTGHPLEFLAPLPADFLAFGLDPLSP